MKKTIGEKNRKFLMLFKENFNFRELAEKNWDDLHEFIISEQNDGYLFSRIFC